MYNALLAFLAIFLATTIMCLFVSVSIAVTDSDFESILLLIINLLTIPLFISLFAWIYKKAYGKSMFEKNISDLKHKATKKGNRTGIIYVKSKRSDDGESEIYLFIIAIFILIINVSSEELRNKELYVTTGILCLIGFILKLFRNRKELSADLTSYAHSSLFAGIAYYKKWYKLPDIKKIGISNTSFMQPTSDSNIARSSNRVVEYRLFLRFHDTSETLTLLTSKNVNDLKEERHRLREEIKGVQFDD